MTAKPENSSAPRLRLATVWLGGCSGCHMSFLDLDESLIDLAAVAELVYSPILDVKEYPENVDVALVEGAVCNEDHLAMIQRVRRNTRRLVAFGDCAVTGNVSAMRNPLGKHDVVLQRAYVETAAAPGQLPVPDGILPPLLSRVCPLHQIVPVDLYLPGCPPPADRIQDFLARTLAEERGQPVFFGTRPPASPIPGSAGAIASPGSHEGEIPGQIPPAEPPLRTVEPQAATR